MNDYFIISGSDDGVSINKVSKKELLQRITPNEDDENYYGEASTTKILTELPQDINNFYGLVIIKGEVITPIKTVTFHLPEE